MFQVKAADLKKSCVYFVTICFVHNKPLGGGDFNVSPVCDVCKAGVNMNWYRQIWNALL